MPSSASLLLYKSYNIPIIRVLLLENIHSVAVKLFKDQLYEIDVVHGSLSPEELKAKIRNVHILGIRSKTQMNRDVLNAASDLLAIGCYCIGTDQVDLEETSQRGIAVFNSAFSNSRSVAELVIGEIIALSRQLGDRNMELHGLEWNKISKGCHEVRGKTLGIVGYGHIGSQLSVLAESLGMVVVYHDIQPMMPHGLAKCMHDLKDLLAASDFVSLHVPDTPETRSLMSAKELSMMKKGSYLINASRGKVVDLKALKEALDGGHLAGAALDVYPIEPESNGLAPLETLSGLQSCKNVILTPHIGGSTEEAQFVIGQEVAQALIRFIQCGSTIGSVQFPEVELRSPVREGQCRLINTHKNVPGVLNKINKILSSYNICKQTSESKIGVAHLIADLDRIGPEKNATTILELIENNVQESMCTRLIYGKDQFRIEKK